MVKISMYRTGDSHFSVKAVGHAGYTNEEGKDIVCSAVSILTYTFATSFDNLGAEIDFKEVPGDSICVCDFKDTSDNIGIKAQAVYDTIKLGYMMLQDRHTENVQVEFIEI